MPRRKGHGIPPTKRVKQPDAISRSAPLKNKLYNEISSVTAKEEPIQMTVNTVPIKSEPPSIISDAFHSKYLHKKFKKMASTLLPEESNQINNVLNGSRFIKSGCRVPDLTSDREKLSPPTGSPKAEVPVSNSRVISPPAGRYVCSYCKLACAKPSVLQKHIRAHTNERPYPCLPCGFAFKTKSNLYKHCRSRAHASKLEESGEKMSLVFDGEEAATSEDDDSPSSVSNAASLTSKADTDPENREDTPKSIYKPKYRFMDQPLKSPQNDKLDERKENSHSPPRLHLKIPVPNTNLSVVSTPSPFTSGSSPSPEFIHRHISKLISENQAIVETNDPFWTKKFMQRTNSSDNSSPSPLSTSPSPADMCSLKKTGKLPANSDTLQDVNCDKVAPKHSKLALALLRPQSSVSPKFINPVPTEVCDVQPLNLSTNSKEQSLSQQNRKRSYSEGFPDRSPKLIKEKVNAVPLTTNSNSVQDFRRFTSTLAENNASILVNHLDIKKELLGNPQNPEGSIIKDLLLKARAGGSAVSPSLGAALSASAVDVKPFLSITPPNCDERAYSPSSEFMCHLCKEPLLYRNAESLEIHQLYHCKGNDTSSRSSLNSPSPHADIHHVTSPYRKTCPKEGPMLIAPSHPSPGPLLGSTPLVESYRTRSPHAVDSSTVFKKRKLDGVVGENRVISATTLRSLEELSKCPMRSNLQMFGGEVKIIDNSGGESKTIRIEPSNRASSKTPSEVPLQIGSHSGKNVMKEMNNLQDSNMIVTIAKQGLHSGGSIVQLPHKLGVGDQQIPRQVPASRNNMPVTSASRLPGFQDSNKLLIPIIPNAVTPNISLPGIPTPVQLPFIPFTSLLSETNKINPLTNITAYNPLTLPPASLLQPDSPGVGIPSVYSSGIVTILHGGKEIPYVPGMPGPHTLLPNHSVPVYSSQFESDIQFVKLSESKSSSHQDQFQRNIKNDKSQQGQSVISKPSSLNIPTIQVNSEMMNSPVDQSSGTHLRKRSMEENQPVIGSKPGTPKSSQVFTLPTESEEMDEGPPEKKFLRPTSLPLKPGTFIPKRQQLTPVLSLVSPETPRPRKSYGQLYLNGHAYTYLGLKCSTRMFFCTLNKPQPIYVPLSPEHNKVSMYSNWKVCTEADPNPYGLDPGRAMALYDSRHRPSTYTLARSRNCEAITHSTYWTSRQHLDEFSDREETSEALPKRVKIFAGGFESNEDYIYVRGRGRGRYVCEECGIRCKKPSMLKKHIRTHTDVRPFTCIHCKFSFKTKGNLTKHMKSKAHYKKCIDLGILPVPTVVDDSYVDEEALAHQQALRENQGVDPEESDEDEEEEEDETEDDEDEDEDEGEEGQTCVEREAARSLLTLSETIQSATLRQHASAGLVAVSARPSTYPYSFTQMSEASIITQPQTPTLTAISAQREREKVSQNTGLAREVQGEVKARETVEESKGNCGEKGVAARYYFPSSHDLGDSPAESTVRVKQSTPMDLSNKTPEKSPRVCEAAMLLASLCSTMERLPITTIAATVSEDSALLQAYLTERAVQDSRMKQHQYKHKAVVIELADQRAKSKPASGLNISAAKENALGILAQTSSDARKLPACEPASSAANKPQAEFLPPSSGPSPSYVSILEDGRSMCNICNKVFSKPSQLRLHVNIHYFERPFRCESCAVSFRTKGHLQKHQRSVSHLNKVNMNSTFGTATTTNPRPFKCDDCKIAFRIHGHLAKHLRSKMHIMKLECLGKLPFGTYAEMERSGINMNDIDTTDCENSLESLQLLAQKLYEKDPSKLGQWDPMEMMPHHALSSGDTSSEGEDEDIPSSLPGSQPLPHQSSREQLVANSLGPVLSPIQRLPPPPIQKVSLSNIQCSVEPLKCVINICNSSVNTNHKGPKHRPLEGSEDRLEPVSDRRTDESGEG